MDKTRILSRISRDGERAIIREKKGFRTIDLSTREYSSETKTLGALVASGSWRRPTAEEKASFANVVEEPVVSEEEAAEILSAEESEDLEYPSEIYDFNDDYDFFATPYGDTEDSVDGVYALDPETGDLYLWQDGEFTPVGEQSLDPEIPEKWVLIDAETAQYIADWKDHRDHDEEFCSLFGNDPAEKELFDSAESSEDWEFIDNLSAVLADASGYTPQERSRNATKQRRGPGGRFAQTPGKGDEKKKEDETRNPEVEKTYLPAEREIVLLPNPLNFIVEFIGSASPSTGPSIGGGVAVTAAGTEDLPQISEEAQKATREQTLNSPDAVYFAIVHKDDNRAVQDVVAITKSEAGTPEAWRRANGEWVKDVAILADLQSVTPPPVVQLDEETVKTVVDGIDKHDAGAGAEQAPTAQGTPVQASGFKELVRKGYAMHDGSFLIKNEKDLVTAVKFAPENASFDIKSHIVKRAKALNRMDVVPEEWRALSAISEAPLFNSYGEVIIAAGNRGGNAETLRRYWAEGKGAAKIRWGTEGDLSRCHRKLSKYMPGRAWGYCQNLHQRKYGMSNYKKDNG